VESVPEDVAQALGRSRSRQELRTARVLVLLLSLVSCAYLARTVYATAWTMDADEAVHAIEALRLHDRMVQGDAAGFLRDTYFPERWHAPVQPHVRWYPFVHAWFVQPFFLVLGASDFSARLPSIVLLFGTTLCFFAIARRLAPKSPARSGVLAVVLLLAAPNVLTFSAQSLIATTGLFFTYLALLAYLWSLEREHPASRAWLAGLALGVAALTKYDHGGFLALMLGLSELGRARFSIPRFYRSGAVPLFATAFVMVLAWFAHPDKLDALGDSVRHPLPSSLSRTVRDTGATLFVEYASSIAVGLGALMAFASLWRRCREPGLRAVWLWALCSTAFYVLRGRFYFRYNIVEAPAFLLFLALQLPLWWEATRDWLMRAATRSDLRRTFVLVPTTSAVFGLALLCRIAPELPFRWSSGTPFSLTEDYLDVFRYLGTSLMALSSGAFLLCVARLVLHGGTTRQVSGVLVVAALALPALPGGVHLYLDLDRTIDWELEGHPQIGELCAFVDEQVDRAQNVLLAGGWDQLTNNTLRWYLLTGGEDAVNFEDVFVAGDMIGSIVFPPEPRVAYWVETLALADVESLPDYIVRVTPNDDFLYHTWMGNEGALYETVLAQRAAYVSVGKRTFGELGCDVEVLRRERDVPPLSGIPAVRSYERRKLSPEGWSFSDDALRHFVRR